MTPAGKQLKTMFLSLTVAWVAGMGAAQAAPHLTPQECHAYPFTKASHPLTHHDVMQELGELEAVGYEPSASEYTYPSPVTVAEQKLRVEYRHDCLPAAHLAQVRGGVRLQ